MQVARVYPEKKTRMLDTIRKYSMQYKTIALLKMEKIRAEQLMSIRKKFGEEFKIIMVKNNIAKKALSNSNIKSIEKIVSKLSGQNALIFTNLNPFKLYLILDKEKTSLPAKGGDIATEDIIVPAGNTGLAPGPVLSEFREAKMQTKIEGGTIWIAKDSTVAKAGEEISFKLASLLSKLGIKPIKAGLVIDTVLEDGLLYTPKDLKIDIDGTKRVIEQSFSEALNLAVNAAYPIKESIMHILRKAYTNARTLSINSSYTTKETIADILALSELKAKSIYEEAKKKGYQ